MRIVDSHQHLWDLNQVSCSWLAGFPPLNRSFAPEEYRAATAQAGADIAASVYLEADVDEACSGDETRWISQLAERPDSVIRAIVAAVRPESEAFPEQLARLREYPLVRGVRRVLHTMPDDLAQAPLFARHLRQLAAFDLSFDLCVLASQLPVALELVRACPETRFVLDHCGNPRLGRDLSGWRANMAALAACPNVVCKLSGIVLNGEGMRWSPDKLRPCVRHVVEVFGPDRVLWGSDWPVCTLATDYKGWFAAALELTAHLNQIEWQKVWHDNAARVYRLEPPTATVSKSDRYV